MSFQVMHALGVSIPCDLVDRKAINEALDIVRLAQDRNVQILYPKDFWCQKKCDPKQLQVFPSHGILDGTLFFKLIRGCVLRHYFCSANKVNPKCDFYLDWVPVDLGPASLDEIGSTLTNCKVLQLVYFLNMY